MHLAILKSHESSSIAPTREAQSIKKISGGNDYCRI
jgi:hypothetical protein